MEDRREQEELARAEFVRDREMVDAVMAAIDEEDRLHGELKRAKAAETRHYIAEFIADRDARREAERRAEFESERKIQVPLANTCSQCLRRWLEQMQHFMTYHRAMLTCTLHPIAVDTVCQ